MSGAARAEAVPPDVPDPAMAEAPEGLPEEVIFQIPPVPGRTPGPQSAVPKPKPAASAPL